MTVQRICSPQIRLDADSALGGVVYDRELLKAIADHGVQVAIPIALPPARQEAGWDCRSLRMSYFSRGAGAALNALFYQEIWRSYRRERFDVLRVFNLRYAGLPALCFRRLTGVPVVAHIHHLEGGRLEQHFDRRLAEKCDGITVLSHFTASQVQSSFGIDRSCISICPPGVSDRYRPGPPNRTIMERHGLKGRLVLLTMSVVRRRKNLEALVTMMADVVKHHPNAVLLICGALYEPDSGYIDELLRQVSTLGLGNAVRFVGRVTEDEKIAYYNTADVFVFASRLEGFGMVVAEAMACGVPVVATKAGAIPEVLGNEGVLVEDAHPAALARVVVAQLSQGRTYLKYSGAAAAARAQRFNWKSTATQTLAFYESILERAASA